jgi:DNA-directed RNA polymerase specialized sigma24 family protein
MDLDVTAGLVPRRHGGTPADSVGGEAGCNLPDPATAVGALYVEHALGLVRLAHIMLGSRQAAEDVVQEAFLGLYRHWLRLDDQAKALGYLRSSVLNGCRSVLGRQPVRLESARYGGRRHPDARRHEDRGGAVATWGALRGLRVLRVQHGDWQDDQCPAPGPGQV